MYIYQSAQQESACQSQGFGSLFLEYSNYLLDKLVSKQTCYKTLRLTRCLTLYNKLSKRRHLRGRVSIRIRLRLYSWVMKGMDHTPPMHSIQCYLKVGIQPESIVVLFKEWPQPLNSCSKRPVQTRAYSDTLGNGLKCHYNRGVTIASHITVG